MTPNVKDIFIDALGKIIESKEYGEKDKVKALFNMLTTVIEEITDEEKISFTTLFSRLAFLGNKFELDSTLLYHLHKFRRDNERAIIKSDFEHYIVLGKHLIESLLQWIWDNDKNISSLPSDTASYFSIQEKQVVQFRYIIEGIIDSVDTENYKVFFYDEEEPTILKTALFDQADKNEIFNSTIEMLSRSFTFPIHANFIDVSLTSDGDYIPMAIVVDPDYLIDVTSVANCFKDYGTESILRLLSKFKSAGASIPLMVGNIANLFLDEIISNPEIQFKELHHQIFKLNPLAMAVFSDSEIRKLIIDAKNHYLNLKKTVAVDFPKQGINRSKVFLEPSFYSRDFGLQGRLDLFHQQDDKKKFDIVELKSGKLFRANVYGLNAPHYSQTLLYDLMIKSTFGYGIKPNNFILYSKLEEKTLRYAPPVKSQQYEAMKIRNELIGMEYKLGESEESVATIFNYIKPKNFPKIKGYEQKDVEQFEKNYNGLSDIERSYLNSYISFIAREHKMAKTGEHGINKANGLAALWLENMEEKEDRFGLLRGMVIKENHSKAEVPTVILSRSDATSKLANFREGDIAVLYPYMENPRAVLSNQIFKCTILKIDEHQVEVKLRSRQYNDKLFNTVESWNIEEDSLDSGFLTLYRSVFEFINSKSNIKDLWLGRKAPRKPLNLDFSDIDQLTSEQNHLLSCMMNARDYFLLWGPPGTGKTSIMLRSMVHKTYLDTEDNILLLAYTNRAVDEMCQAIESISEDFRDKYIRIGSHSNCGEAYRDRLINNLISEMTSRIEIQTLVKSKRIFVSTVSSIISKTELFSLKNFNTVIIDEASQILEPNLMGLLSRVEKTILIGDHKQLPAVVTQSPEKSKITNQALISLGITDRRMSLFERLYYQCVRNEWNHAFGLLSHQGRMHNQLMRFPNNKFYDGKLKILPVLDRLTGKRDLKTKSPESKVLSSERFIYVPTHVDEAFNWKTNKYEAGKVFKLLKHLREQYILNGKSIEQNSIGIITPYRAQIATIKQLLEKNIPELLPHITIDTVERYQGGAREIIILSLCTNRLSQLRSLISLSDEGVDRKLNVAITRAKEQLIIIGNRDILSKNQTYLDLIDSAYEWKI